MPSEQDGIGVKSMMKVKSKDQTAHIHNDDDSNIHETSYQYQIDDAR